MHTVGIDVGKRYHVAVTLDANGQPVGKALRFTNDQAGFGQLQERLAGVGEVVLIGLEATGHYWLALYTMLSDAGYELVVLNPLQIHAYRKSGIRKRKNDRYDAYWIADYIRISQQPPSSQPPPALLQLRELTRFRASLTEQVGDCKRKVIRILDRVFPEYETLFSNVFIQSSRRLLAEVLTPDEFADFDLTELAQLLAETSRGRHGQAKAEELQSLARRSVGVGFLGNTLRVQMTCLLQQLVLLAAQRLQLEAEITALMDRLPQFIQSRSESLGKHNDDALRTANVAEPELVLVLCDFAYELSTMCAQARKDVLDVVDGEHDATYAQGVHRCVLRLGSDRRWGVELVQLNPTVAVRGSHHRDLASNVLEPNEKVHVPPQRFLWPGYHGRSRRLFCGALRRMDSRLRSAHRS